jgi:hypothetical protein
VCVSVCVVCDIDLCGVSIECVCVMCEACGVNHMRV